MQEAGLFFCVEHHSPGGEIIPHAQQPSENLSKRGSVNRLGISRNQRISKMATLIVISNMLCFNVFKNNIDVFLLWNILMCFLNCFYCMLHRNTVVKLMAGQVDG